VVSYLELLLYNMRYVQEHAGQLSLFLGQHGGSDEALVAVARARQEHVINQSSATGLSVLCTPVVVIGSITPQQRVWAANTHLG
jgi:hypothetical protein